MVAYLEACVARRKGTTNRNQIQLNHGTSDPTRRHEPLDVTSAERLRTQEFEWIKVKRGTKMEDPQRPPPATIQTYNVEQRESAQTDASLAAKPAKKKKKSQQKADGAPSQAEQQRQAIHKEVARLIANKKRERKLKRRALQRKQDQLGPNYQRYYYMLKNNMPSSSRSMQTILVCNRHRPSIYQTKSKLRPKRNAKT